jgi:hypothetical protein
LAAGQLICRLRPRLACRLYVPTYKFNRTNINIFCLHDTHCCYLKSVTQTATKVNSAIVHHNFISRPASWPPDFSLGAGRLFLTAGWPICRLLLGGWVAFLGGWPAAFALVASDRGWAGLPLVQTFKIESRLGSACRQLNSWAAGRPA